MLDERKKKILDELWCENVSRPTTSCGVNELYNSAKENGVTLAEVKNYLSTKRSYTLHKVGRKKFPRQRVVTSGPRMTLASDLADMQHLARQNKGVRYLLVCIDTFSRFLYVVPLLDKRGITCARALKKIFSLPESSGYRRFWTDAGKEFVNREVDKVLEERNIKRYQTFSHEIKVSIAERVIRTLKGRIYRYLTEHGTHTYLPVLGDLVIAYNSHPHRGLLGQTPNEVHRFTSPYQCQQHFHRTHSKWYKTHMQGRQTFSILRVGDAVRIPLEASIFRRGFEYQNTEEIFIIDRIDSTKGVVGYYLRDLDGDPLEGIFYREELVKTCIPTTYAIDVLRSRKKGKELLIHFRGYHPRHDKWVRKEEITTSAHA